MLTTEKIQHLHSDWVDPTPEKPPSTPRRLPWVQWAFIILGRIFPRWAGKIAFRLFTTPRKRARHRQADTLLAQARVFEVLSGKYLLKCYEWGEGTKTVLLVHGWESRGTALRSFVPPLLERGYRVVAVDGPAHGDSGGRRVSLLQFGQAVQAVIHRLGTVGAIITHSFGGAASIYALSVLEPELCVEKMVLIATPNRIERVFLAAARTMRLPKRATAHFRRLLEKEVGLPLPEVALSRLGPQTRVREALIIHDTGDRAVSMEAAQLLANDWPAATLLVSDGYGHFRLMKNPDIVRAVADFIAPVG